MSPELNFDEIDDAEDFSPIPEDKYLCVLDEVKEDQTQYGDEMWNLTFVVMEGDNSGKKYEGRKLFDRLVFSQNAVKRVKLVCSRLGLDVSGKVNLKPSMLLGRFVYVETVIEEYEDNEGKSKKRNSVPFAGYQLANQDQVGKKIPVGAGKTGKKGTEEDDIPF